MFRLTNGQEPIKWELATSVVSGAGFVAISVALAAIACTSHLGLVGSLLLGSADLTCLVGAAISLCLLKRERKLEKKQSPPPSPEEQPPSPQPPTPRPSPPASPPPSPPPSPRPSTSLPYEDADFVSPLSFNLVPDIFYPLSDMWNYVTSFIYPEPESPHTEEGPEIKQAPHSFLGLPTSLYSGFAVFSRPSAFQGILAARESWAYAPRAERSETSTTVITPVEASPVKKIDETDQLLQDLVPLFDAFTTFVNKFLLYQDPEADMKLINDGLKEVRTVITEIVNDQDQLLAFVKKEAPNLSIPEEAVQQHISNYLKMYHDEILYRYLNILMENISWAFGLNSWALWGAQKTPGTAVSKTRAYVENHYLPNSLTAERKQRLLKALDSILPTLIPIAIASAQNGKHPLKNEFTEGWQMPGCKTASWKVGIDFYENFFKSFAAKLAH